MPEINAHVAVAKRLPGDAAADDCLHTRTDGDPDAPETFVPVGVILEELFPTFFKQQ